MAIIAAPGRSMRGRCARGSSFRISSSAPMTNSGAAITLMRSAHRHEYCVVRKPPTNGPNATDAPATVPHAANATARSAPTNVVDRIDSVAGISSDAPMPSMIASPSTSVGTECDTDASSDPTPKMTAPMTNMRRCPYMSPSRPPMTRNVANVSEYPVITHWRLGRSVWNSRRIVGMATLRIVLSSTGIATETITTAAANQRRGSGSANSGKSFISDRRLAYRSDRPGRPVPAPMRRSRIPAIASGRSQPPLKVTGHGGHPTRTDAPRAMTHDR